jgi:hypothetical protein
MIKTRIVGRRFLGNKNVMETKKTKRIWAMAGTGVLILVIGFFGGMKYGESKAPQSGISAYSGSQQAGGFGMMRRNGGGMMQNGNFAGGQVISKDDKSITVQLRDGSSKIVFVSGTTEVMKSVTGSSSDLAVGEQVTVNGTANSDGSITAQTVQIRPAQPTTGQ